VALSWLTLLVLLNTLKRYDATTSAVFRYTVMYGYLFCNVENDDDILVTKTDIIWQLEKKVV